MSSLRLKHIAPALRVFGGTNALQSLGGELEREGRRRTAVVCSPSMIGHTYALAKVEEALGGKLVARFGDVQEHSPVEVVESVRDLLRESGADSVVVVGGGSAMVTARAATILLAEKRSVRDLCTRRGVDGRLVSPRLNAPKLPQWIVPSTPTTAFAKAGSAVQDPDTRERLTMFDPKSRALGVFFDPDVAMTAPVSLVDSSSSNALSMAVGGLLSGIDNPIALSALEGSLRQLSQWWPELRKNPGDPEIRMRLMVAALLSGQGSDHTGAGVAQLLAHAIGPRTAASNGEVEAIALPAAMRYISERGRSGYRQIVRATDTAANPQKSDEENALNAIRDILRDVPQGRSLREIGIVKKDFDFILDSVMNDWFYGTLERSLARRELNELLLEIW